MRELLQDVAADEGPAFAFLRGVKKVELIDGALVYDVVALDESFHRVLMAHQLGWTHERTLAALDRLCERGLAHRCEPNSYPEEDGRIIHEPLTYFYRWSDPKEVNGEVSWEIDPQA
jgi:hypothetical protein